jgi:two-component system, NtrC family, sensor kinase
VSAGEFNQVMLNLIVNAAHAIADQQKDGVGEWGRIKVATRDRARWVEILVGDTGVGIPAAVRSRIFDPFFTNEGDREGNWAGAGDRALRDCGQA